MLRAMMLMVLVLCPCVLYAQAAPSLPLPRCQVQFDNGRSLASVPLADNEASRMQGLSRQADVSDGMWFAFEQPQLLRFWMRDTWQPLSIGFIDAQGQVFQIVDMTPMSLDVHQSIRPGVAALELPQGGFAALGVHEGMQVTLHHCQP